MQFLKKVLYRFQHRSLVLMYHNIAEPAIDPWELAVSPGNFRQHLEVLKQHRVLSVSAFAEALKTGRLPKGAVSLTFDDGYEDNFLHAAPLLSEFETPAMFFISTEYIGGNKMFWWDELAEILLGGETLPEVFSMSIGHENFSFSLEEDAGLTPEKLALQTAWKWHQPPPTKRCELYFEVWKRLRPLPYEQITGCMNLIRAWTTLPPLIPVKHAMSLEQLLRLKNNSFIETGIHTRTHPALSNHSADVQRSEISDCRDRLLTLELKASHVAFPYGNFNDDTLKVCREMQLAAGFTTSERMTVSDTDPMQISRFQVRNVNGKEFEKQLKTWMTESPS